MLRARGHVHACASRAILLSQCEAAAPQLACARASLYLRAWKRKVAPSSKPAAPLSSVFTWVPACAHAASYLGSWSLEHLQDAAHSPRQVFACARAATHSDTDFRAAKGPAYWGMHACARAWIQPTTAVSQCERRCASPCHSLHSCASSPAEAYGTKILSACQREGREGRSSSARARILRFDVDWCTGCDLTAA